MTASTCPSGSGTGIGRSGPEQILCSTPSGHQRRHRWLSVGGGDVDDLPLFNELSEQNKKFRKAKDASEVKAIVAPKAPSKRFELLLKTATDALSEVRGGYATSDILRKHFTGRLDLPGQGDPLKDEYFEAQEAGMISIDDEDSTVTLVRDFYKLDEALDSIDELLSFFDEQISSNESFKGWFVDKYNVTPKLTAEATWKKIIRQ